ncbi:MAG: polysaccharide pyruvyl transferase family protein [Thermoguttaceae bacterium]
MHGQNYGCDLQRYAMQQVLKRFGLRALLIDYVPQKEGAPRVSAVRRFVARLRPVPLAKMCLSFLDQRRDFFRRFERTFLEATEPFGDYSAMERGTARFDCCVAGSDQIWNPSLCRGETNCRFFMLDFVPAGKKISYAPSLGVSEVEPDFADRLKRYLSSFDWLSVREREGAEILRFLLGREVDVVLDPTMLLTAADWDRVGNTARRYPFQKKEYLLCYSLGNTDQVLKAARRLNALYRARIAVFCYSPLDFLRLKYKCPESLPILNAGPAEFVDLIRSAVCVVTDSFHGSIFSILYHRPFWTMMRDRRTGAFSMNSRIKTLFETFHLEERLFDPNDFTPEVREIDHAAVEEILLRQRASSFNRLEGGLRKVLCDG